MKTRRNKFKKAQCQLRRLLARPEAYCP